MRKMDGRERLLDGAKKINSVRSCFVYQCGNYVAWLGARSAMKGYVLTAGRDEGVLEGVVVKRGDRVDR